MKMTDTTFLTRVRLKNYKSIAVCGRREEQFSRCASHYQRRVEDNSGSGAAGTGTG